MDNTENDSLLKALRVSLIGTPFIFTLLYIPGFMFPGSFPRSIFLYVAVSLILVLWLLYSFKQERIVIQKNWLTVAVFGYIAVLFISALTGGHFEYSFFGVLSRMTSIVAMLYISFWYLIASSVLQKKDWTYLLRLLLLSGFILAIISFLNINGFNIELFSFLTQGGSLFGNNTFSGIYYLFVFFIGVILWAKETSWRWRISYGIAMFVVLFNPDIFNFQIWQNPALLKDVFHNPMLVLGTAQASSATMGIGIIAVIIMYIIHKVQSISVITKGVLYGALFAGLLLFSIVFTWSATTQEGFVYDFLASEGGHQRPVAWDHGVQSFKNKPMLGYGLNNFEYAFQDSLDARIPFLYGGKWFDKAHNGWIDTLVETGILGLFAMAAIFFATCWYSFKHYRRTGDFSATVVVLLLVLHIIQIQTSFNINTSLYMVFILLAYIASYAPTHTPYALSRSSKILMLSLGSGIVLVSMVFTAIIPAMHSRAIVASLTSANFEKRMNLYQSLHSLYGYPADMIYTVFNKFTNAWLANPAEFDNETAIKGIGIEYNEMLDLFETHYEQYEDNLRYNINYAHAIFIARLFSIDRLDRAGELIVRAQELSTSIPQVFWLASLHAKYTGNETLAFEEADRAIVLCEVVRAKFDENQLGEFCGVSYSLRGFLEKTKGLKNKLYFHLEEV